MDPGFRGLGVKNEVPGVKNDEISSKMTFLDPIFTPFGPHFDGPGHLLVILRAFFIPFGPHPGGSGPQVIQKGSKIVKNDEISSKSRGPGSRPPHKTPALWGVPPSGGGQTPDPPGGVQIQGSGPPDHEIRDPQIMKYLISFKLMSIL